MHAVRAVQASEQQLKEKLVSERTAVRQLREKSVEVQGRCGKVEGA